MTIQALLLDVRVVDALLKRGRSNHGRTRYFQQVSMALRAFHRYELEKLENRIQALSKSVEASESKDGKKKPSQWDMKHIIKQKSFCQAEVLQVQTVLLNHLPEVLDRIHHAACALSLEMTRGFFLPFCTVVFAALSRIRKLLMQMGQRSLDDFQRIGRKIATKPLLSFDKLAKARNDYFEVEDCKTSVTDEALLRLGMQLREIPVKKEVIDTSHDSQLALSKENSKSSSCNPVVKGFDEMDVGESNSLVENPAGLANSFQKEEALEGYTRTKGNSSVANSQLKKGSKRKLKRDNSSSSKKKKKSKNKKSIADVFFS